MLLVDTDPVLVLSPHPDDAVLGCSAAVDPEGPGAQVVNVFAGIPPPGVSGGWDRECGVPDSAEMMRRRRAEDERALALADVRPIHLDFLDMQYAEEVRDIETIAAAVRLAVPRWSALYAPAALGGLTRLLHTHGMTLVPHPDHEAVRKVALELERHDAPTYFYAELVYGFSDRPERKWPQGLAAFTPVLEAATSRALELVVTELSDDALARRMRAMGEYHTQVSPLEAGVGSFFRDPDVLRHEAYWSPPPAGRARGSR